jgi:hypothetical protein
MSSDHLVVARINPSDSLSHVTHNFGMGAERCE